MAHERRKKQRSPLILVTHCAMNGDTVDAYEYFTCFIKDASPVGAGLVTTTRLFKGQLLVLVMEMHECLVSVLMYASVIWVKEAAFGSRSIYTAGLKFFEVGKTARYPNLVDFSKVENSLMRHASYFRNVPWLSIRTSRCLSANIGYGQ
jgi:hypothetical protein